MMRLLLTTFTAACLLATFSFAQDDELKNGLIGRYQSGERVISQVDADVAFHWGSSKPFAKFESQAWSASWTGQLLVQSLTPYRFYVQASGEVLIEVDGQAVLQTQTESPAWTAGNPVKISAGFQDIVVRYQPTDQNAELKLFWSSEEFDIEPIPTHLLFHEEDDSQLQLVEEGRILFAAHRCANCHHEPNNIDQIDPALALWGVTSGTNPEWIVQKLLAKHPEVASDKMPNFGLTQAQAEDIAAYLHRLDAPFDLMTTPDGAPKKGEPSGEELFNSLGCLACHQVGDLGTEGPFSGSPLTNIGNKRSADWIATWLSAPNRLNPQHRMPIFKLSRSERGRLAQYLSSLGKQPETKFGRSSSSFTTEQTDRGQNLVKEFQCANCHKIPAIEAAASPVKPLTSAPPSWENSCLSKSADPAKHRPSFPQLNRPAIAAYIKTLATATTSPPSEYERGKQLIERSQCLACHSRGSAPGLKAISLDIAKATPLLSGQTQLVIPPSLNAVGDKLQDAVLDEALSGKQDRIRADWLKVRMPQFDHSAEELAALKHYFIEHDRIPANTTKSHQPLRLSQNELLLIGRKLVGAGGWSCIACHQIGDYVPKNTALGTRGSDLMAIGKRIRPEFYYRWTRAPIRIVPGMEMPSFVKPVQGVLDEHVHSQLTAVWFAVNDPRFEPPTNPSQVEQLLQIAQGESPRIVRDVFTVDEANGGGTVARAFAVGFDNQHGALFDLDNVALRDWKFGDFARQRTVGKSWYWDLAGATIVKGLTPDSDLALYDEVQKQIVTLQGQDADRLAHLRSYSINEGTIRLKYDLKIVLNENHITIPVTEHLQTLTDPGSAGWQRQIIPSDVPDGFRLVFAQPQFESEFATSIRTNFSEAEDAISVEAENAVYFVPKDSSAPTEIKVSYQSDIKAPPTALPEVKPVFATTEKVLTLPGYVGERLPLPISVMPTSISQDDQNRILFTSLKGHLLRATDKDGDGLQEDLEMLQEGLSAAFGVIADGKDLLVTHKPELLRLSDTDGDGNYEHREVVADGWGHSDNYHDWVTGPVFDENGSLFLATGSDYAQPKRDRRLSKWRGKVIEATTNGDVQAVAHELRYPIGIATDAKGRIFVSDQQGVQNTFNEINLIQPGAGYGVPGQLDGEGSPEPKRATIQIPHPWTRSVNGIFFLPAGIDSPFAGHGIGCEFNSKFLIRFTTQEVGGELQGACYHFSKPTWENEANTFLGPIAGYASKTGEIYVGSIYDSGWLGGPNVGEIVRLKPTGDYGNGIRELRAIPGGFEIEFLQAVDPDKAIDKDSYSLSGYTRVWQGSYATDDSGRYTPEIKAAVLGADQRTVTLHVDKLKPSFVYELNVKSIDADGKELFPAFAAYTLNVIPE